MATSFKQRKTPGVYITEFDAFPKSIVGVATAIPAFIGYTEKATISGKPVYFKPIPLSSLADYQAVFGKGFVPTYNIEEAHGSPPPPDSYDFVVLACETLCSPPQDEDAYYKLVQWAGNESSFNLYNSMRLFFDNGGGNCYVVSVGDYTDQGTTLEGVKIDPEKLTKGLNAVADQTGPTMLVIPDAVLLESGKRFYKLANDMLDQCGAAQDRVAILDVYDTETLDQEKPTFEIDLKAVKDQFYIGLGDNPFLNYGMAYFPFLNSSVVQPNEILYTNFDIGIRGGDPTPTLETLQNDILTVEAQRLYNKNKNPLQYATVSDYIRRINPNAPDAPADPAAVTKLNQNLVNALPILGQIENVIAAKANLLPPSGAMAGVFTLIDQTRGVWNAPANTTLGSVISPTLKINNEEQGDLNKPLNGKAIDVIRQFPGRGSVVWGARTLDGNSGDWRYIQVRRTLIYVEQSIKNALDQFVFAANDGKTWVAATSMVSNFLQGLWSQGGLMGATATEAFTVECGLGSTMTPADILEGYMVVQVTLQMIHPAEFIELTFKQKMQGGA